MASNVGKIAPIAIPKQDVTINKRIKRSLKKPTKAMLTEVIIKPDSKTRFIFIKSPLIFFPVI